MLVLFFGILSWVQDPAVREVEGPFLFMGVSLHENRVAFSLDGKIWEIPLAGGTARALTTDTGDNIQPRYSPDGRYLAYTKRASGDIFLLDRTTERERQWTVHPGFDLPLTWTPDGSRLVFLSNRYTRPAFQLFTIAPDEPLARAMPMPFGTGLSFEPGGGRFAFVPHGQPALFSRWDGYRGGLRAPLWIVDPQKKRAREIVGSDWDVKNPMWTLAGLYFTSRKHGTGNLYFRNAQNGEIRAVTRYREYGIQQIAHDGQRLVWVRDGFLYAWDADRPGAKKINFKTPLVFKTHRTRLINTARWVEEITLGQGGSQACIVARGEVFLKDLATGKNRNLTQSGGVHEHHARISPDGKQLAYFSDRDGPYQIHIRSLDESGTIQNIAIESQPNDYRELQWDSTGQKLTFSDVHGRLWLYDTGWEQPRIIDRTEDPGQLGFDGDWSSGGRYFVYNKRGTNRVRRLWLHDTQTGENHVLTQGVLHAWNPRFDANGRYLYFLESPNAVASDIYWGVLSANFNRPFIETSLKALILNEGDPAPVTAGGQLPNVAATWETVAEDFPFKLDSVESRVLTLNSNGLQWLSFEVGPPGVLYLVSRTWGANGGLQNSAARSLHRLDLRDPAVLEKWVHDVTSLTPVPGKDQVVVETESGWRLVSRKHGQKTQTNIRFGALMARVQIAEEWAQIYWEAHRFARAYFYDAQTHGQRIAGYPPQPVADRSGRLTEQDQGETLDQHYAAFLPNLTRRADLTALLRQTLGEIAVSHLRVGRSDEDYQPSLRAGIGCLGADYEVHRDRYRVTRIYRPPALEQSLFQVEPPLALPGQVVEEGEYILEINSRKVTVEKSIHAWLAGTAGELTRLRVGPNFDGSQARDLVVRPLAQESLLRRACWAGENRRRVQEATEGRVAYVYVPAYQYLGIRSFLAGYLSSMDKKAFIIDQRFNGGGTTSDALIEMLRREPLYAYHFRVGRDVPTPLFALDAPKVLMIDEWNGSAAETFAFMFKLGNVGPIVGRTTAGAGIGGHGLQPTLIDGARLTIPNRAAYDPRGSWGIENSGVQPDHPTPHRPEALFHGSDDMLEKAIEVALDAARRHQSKTYRLPAFPDYSGRRKKSVNEGGRP